MRSYRNSAFIHCCPFIQLPCLSTHTCCTAASAGRAWGLVMPPLDFSGGLRPSLVPVGPQDHSYPAHSFNCLRFFYHLLLTPPGPRAAGLGKSWEIRGNLAPICGLTTAFTNNLNQGSPAPGIQTSTGPWPVRNRPRGKLA